MRRAVVIPMLLATHGLAIWGGLALRGQAPSSPTAAEQPEVAREETKLELSHFVPPQKHAGSMSGPEWEAQVVAARNAIPGDTDVAAMVHAMAAAPNGDFDALQAEAAYLAWIERDLLAALRWRASWGNGDTRPGNRFRTAMLIYLRDKGVAEVTRLREALPEARRPVLMAAAEVAGEAGMQAVGELAVSLAEPSLVLWALEFGLSLADSQDGSSLRGLVPHLPALRRLLDDGHAFHFLSQLGRHAGAASLRDDLVAAGFNRRPLSVFDSNLSSAAWLKERQAIPLAERVRTGMAEKSPTPMLLQRYIAWEVPGFVDWRGDFGDARLSASEMFAKLEAALPGAGSIRGELRELLFRELLPLDAAAAGDWLRGESDWEKILAKVVDDLPYEVSAESLYRLGDGMSPAELEASPLRVAVAERYAAWAKEDAQGCMAAVEMLPEGPLKDRVLTEIRTEENWKRYRQANGQKENAEGGSR